MALLIIQKGADLGVKALYFVIGILFISLVLFFLGSTEYALQNDFSLFNAEFRNGDQFFVVFAIVFPAFTGMTAGVGLSGDLKNPAKSIPMGTSLATVVGMIIYVFVVYKLRITSYNVCYTKLLRQDYGLGIKNIETRVKAMGGDFIFDSVPNAGVTATIEISR